MPTSYELVGDVPVLPEYRQEVKEICDKFNRRTGSSPDSFGGLSASLVEVGEGVLYVCFEGSDHFSFGTSDDLETIAEELNPYVREPVLLQVELDNERRKFYIGPPEQAAETISKDALSEIQNLLGYLTPAHQVKLSNELIGVD